LIIEKKKSRKLLKNNLVEGYTMAENLNPDDIPQAEAFISWVMRAKAALEQVGRRASLPASFSNNLHNENHYMI